jgi:hypothetical protein
MHETKRDERYGETLVDPAARAFPPARARQDRASGVRVARKTSSVLSAASATGLRAPSREIPSREIESAEATWHFFSTRG